MSAEKEGKDAGEPARIGPIFIPRHRLSYRIGPQHWSTTPSDDGGDVQMSNYKKA